MTCNQDGRSGRERLRFRHPSSSPVPNMGGMGTRNASQEGMVLTSEYHPEIIFTAWLTSASGATNKTNVIVPVDHKYGRGCQE